MQVMLMKQKVKSENRLSEVLAGVILITLSILALLGFREGSLQNYQEIGTVGSFLVMVLTALAGKGRILLAIFLSGGGLWLILGKNAYLNTAQKWGIVLLFLTYLAFLHFGHALTFEMSNGQVYFQGALKGQGGGIIGGILALLLYLLFGRIGSKFVFVVLTLIGFILVVDGQFKSMVKTIFYKTTEFFKEAARWLYDFLFPVVEEPQLEDEKKNNIVDKENNIVASTPVISSDELVLKEKNHFDEEEEDVKKREKIDKNPTQTSFLPSPSFKIPPLTLLKLSPRRKGAEERNIRENCRILEDTLANFAIEAKVVEVSVGPVVSRYEMQLAPGIKVSRIHSLADDLALSLAVPQVRIVAPIPGKAAIGIEVPNKESATVSLRDVLESSAFTNLTSPLTFALGQDIAGNPVIADLTKMPHLLIAGATGAGKSVCLNSIIVSLLMHVTPDRLKFLMIDPKMVELTIFNDIPHLLMPVVVDPKKAAMALKYIVNEVEHRYELFSAAGVKDIDRYNSLQENGSLPYIVVIIDELADLMMVSPNEVEDYICRIAQMARAAGVHLVVATQRPSADVITGLIKANMPSRIALAVSSQIDSRVILDMGGAEKLLGRGDMLFLPMGASKPIRLQGAFVSDEEVENVVAFLKEQKNGMEETSEIENIIEQLGTEAEEEIDDPLFPQAVKLVLENGQASISFLQRKLHIGYNRAARLVEEMEKKEIVGGFDGGKSRVVLITAEDYEKIFGST